MTGFSKQALKEVHKERTNHNREVLEQAKQALLMYAYNYPVTTNRGPGRLPCPDLTNDGVSDPLLLPSQCLNNDAVVGRFPFNTPDMEFYDAKDASGESLWYAVSSAFEYGTVPPQINSDSLGTITIFDQTGNLLYDGTTNGVAAVIIAPGAPLAGQDRINDPLDPENYLDSFLPFKNSEFANGSISDSDGFILGPITNNNTIVVNDEFIIITADEVIAMAEKATLQAYRDAIIAYQQNSWGIAVGVAVNYRYPWLDLYSTADETVPLLLNGGDIAPSVSNPVMGRLPSIFGAYFGGSASGMIESEITLDFQYDKEVIWNKTTAIASVFFNGAGDYITDSTESEAQTFYLWDGHATTPHVNSPQDGTWEFCTGTAGTGAGGTGLAEDDCNRKTNGTFKTPADANPTESDVWLEVKIITMDFNPAAGNITFLNADLMGSPLIYNEPTATEHALVSADYNNASGYLNITNDIDLNYFHDTFDDEGDGPAFGADPGDRIRVGIRYYPVLPNWAQVNLWHDDIMLAYSSALQPGGVGACTLPVLPFDGLTNLNLDYCLVLENSGGVTNDTTAMLILAGINSDLVDGGGGPFFLADDLGDIFEGENATPAVDYSNNGFWTVHHNPSPPPPDYARLEANLKYNRRPANDTGNDVILSLE